MKAVLALKLKVFTGASPACCTVTHSRIASAYNSTFAVPRSERLTRVATLSAARAC
jgi:hypothetical protein